MLSAGIVEYARLQYYKKGQVLPEKLHGMQIVRLSVFWQMPQYLLVGLSEVSCLSLQLFMLLQGIANRQLAMRALVSSCQLFLQTLQSIQTQ